MKGNEMPDVCGIGQGSGDGGGGLCLSARDVTTGRAECQTGGGGV
jgi:hypothetical protein